MGQVVMTERLKFDWTSLPPDVLWYLVGLIATDGCLSRDRRHIDVTLKEKDHLERIRKNVGLRCSVSKKLNGTGKIAYHMQIGSRILYYKLLAIGLTPKKSLTLGALQVPDRRFSDFLRGVIDGDGNIRRWIHPTNGREQWAVRVFGCSRPFLAWLQGTAGSSPISPVNVERRPIPDSHGS